MKLRPAVLLAVLSAGATSCDEGRDEFALGDGAGERTCKLVLEAPDAWGEGVEVVSALFDDPRSTNAWAVVRDTTLPDDRYFVRRRQSTGSAFTIEDHEIELGDVPARYRFVEGTTPGTAFLERDRLGIDPNDQNALIQTGYDLWRLDAADTNLPILYKPGVDESAPVPAPVQYNEYRLVVLDGFTFLLVSLTQSTGATWNNYCAGEQLVPKPAEPLQASYLCFFPVRDDLTLGLPRRPVSIGTGVDVILPSVRLGPISNMRANGLALLPIVVRERYTALDELGPIESQTLIVEKLRAIGGDPVIPAFAPRTVMGSTESSALNFNPVYTVQDRFKGYFYIDEVEDPRDGFLAWVDILGFDDLPQESVEPDVGAGARPIQLAEGPAFAWIVGGALQIQTFNARTSPNGVNETLEFGPITTVYTDDGLEAFDVAGPSHLVLRHEDGRDALARIICE